MGKNIMIVILTILFIGTNAWQIYGRIDQGVTMSYMDNELYGLRKTIDAQDTILTEYVKGTSSEEMELKLKRLFPDNHIFIKEGYLHSNFLSFKLDSTKNHIESVGD